MPSWGIASGKGVLQEQGIQDLVNYVESLGTTTSKAQTAAAAEVRDCQTRAACVGKAQLADPKVQAAADAWVTSSKAELVAAQAERAQQTTTDGIATYDKLVEQKQEAVQVAESWQRPPRPRPTDRSCS